MLVGCVCMCVWVCGWHRRRGDCGAWFGWGAKVVPAPKVQHPAPTMCMDSGWCEKKSAMRQPSCTVRRAGRRAGWRAGNGAVRPRLCPPADLAAQFVGRHAAAPARLPCNTRRPATRAPLDPACLDVALGVGLQAVHHVWELHAVADEEDLRQGGRHAGRVGKPAAPGWQQGHTGGWAEQQCQGCY